MKLKWCNAALLLLALLAMGSCLSPKKQQIFRGMEYDTRYKAVPPEELIIQKFDKLDIQIRSDIPQLSAPFNSSLNYSESVAGGTGAPIPYTVSREGTINFPKLGECVVEGMTTRQLESTLAAALEEHGYIKDPVVKVTMQKFEVTVIGTSDQVLTVDGGINLIQLLARVGGPSPTFRMDDVMVIRTIDGARVPHKVDLREKEVFDSPVFYLQQNDIVYFKPRTPIVDPAFEGIFRPLMYITSLGSLITSVLVLVRLAK